MSNNKKNNLFSQILHMISNIISWVLLILLVIIAGFLLYYFITTNICKSKGDTCTPKVTLYTIVSQSMVPTIKVYDVIVNVTPETSDEIEVGDIITFHSTSKLYTERIVTHRVIEKRTNEDGIVEFRTQGDNNISPDDTFVPYSNIIGRVIFKIPQLGRIQFLLTSTGGWVLIIIIPALFLVLFDVLKLKKLLTAKNKVATALEVKEDQNIQSPEVILERKEQLKKKLLDSENLKYQKGYGEPRDFYEYHPERLKVLYETPEYQGEMIYSNLSDEEIEAKLQAADSIEQGNNPIVEETPSSEEINYIEEQSTSNANPNLDAILSRINALETPVEEVELPKLISIKEEVIPDDIELPTTNTKQQVVNIEVAKKKDGNGPHKVVGQIKNNKRSKNRKKNNRRRKH